MKISVVIPAVNEEKYLGKTLEALKGNTRPPDEIVITDGGSTDGTVALAKKYGAKVVVEKKRGIGRARNAGLYASSGDVVAFTDADTIVPKDWLQKIETTLSEKNIIGVFGTFRVPNGWWAYKLYVNAIQPPMIWLYFYLLKIPVAPGQNMAFWREKGIKAGGFPTNFLVMEDLEMIKRLMNVGKVILRPDIVVVSSGRRGGEGAKWFTRTFGSFLLYIIFGKAPIGFKDYR